MTSSGNGVATPTPYQSGMTTSCDTIHLVVSGDGCYDIAAAAGIALAEFYTRNPAVGTTCASLWLDYYSGMTTTCDTFHLVVSGDGCYDIAAAAIALANFYPWNPNVGSTCASLWLGYYVCIRIK
ncbi:hypothetical protein DL95DRAFT_426841 [Leptodontidium sp. 2 PMI_412]|nr:hypothetical protein DL95DRAFT_426841 [Leptodontidium sp. 2 PMI_412]